MLKKISMVALLISVCTAASAVTIFNKPANTKLTKAVTAAEKNATKKDTANKSCGCDDAALERKIKEVLKKDANSGNSYSYDEIKNSMNDIYYKMEENDNSLRAAFDKLQNSDASQNAKIQTIYNQLGMGYAN